MKRELVLFDFDGTLVKGDTFIQFIFFYAGYFKGTLGFIILSPWIVLYILGMVKAETLKQKLVSFYFKGHSENQLKESGKAFVDHLEVSNKLNAELMKKMMWYKEHNNEVCIVSASLDIWLKPFTHKYQIGCLCTEVEFLDGICTGRFATPNCNKSEKARRIKNFYDHKAYSKIIAFGNSVKDEAMFDLADEITKV